jgi:hypothetical protein
MKKRREDVERSEETAGRRRYIKEKERKLQGLY